ncbi:hypothetical protein BASA60_003998 [Batrachochytrium salamandrivorans]|nr:hypothetical protein BASA60_003998 [Batrachochytrium salamandrivorans]
MFAQAMSRRQAPMRALSLLSPTTTTTASNGSVLSAMRTKVSLTPPNVASLRELGRLQSAYPQAHPEIFARMTAFYKAVPKGNATVVKPTTFWGRYYENYVEADTFYPVLHVIGVMIPIGFYLQYYIGGV